MIPRSNLEKTESSVKLLNAIYEKIILSKT